MPTTILLVIPARKRSGSCPGVGGARSPHPPAARSPRHDSPAAAGPRARGSRAPRSPVPPAALLRRATRSARSGGVALGRFLGCPMPHTHIATAIAKQCVDLSIVGDGADHFADEKDVIAGLTLLAHLTPKDRKTAIDRWRREAWLLGHGNLQGGELVRAFA